MNIAWATDTHLDFLTREERHTFYRSISEQHPEALLISGDIGTSHRLADFLLEMAHLALPIYFVLGNHDYYGSSIARIRDTVREISREEYLHWLPERKIVQLTKSTCLIGHGAWADGRYGNYHQSPVLLNDYVQIEDFKYLDKKERLQKLHELGDAAASFIEEMIIRAFQQYRNAILLTHVPPFREACRHEGEMGNDDWLPHFSCKAVGDVLRKVMSAHGRCHLTVLCGHTHDWSCSAILPNLVVVTGRAEYGNPEIQGIFQPDRLRQNLRREGL
jgi:predicted phosphohydrolase